jgi:hypothetical protein
MGKKLQQAQNIVIIRSAAIVVVLFIYDKR